MPYACTCAHVLVSCMCVCVRICLCTRLELIQVDHSTPYWFLFFSRKYQKFDNKMRRIVCPGCRSCSWSARRLLVFARQVPTAYQRGVHSDSTHTLSEAREFLGPCFPTVLDFVCRLTFQCAIIQPLLQDAHNTAMHVLPHLWRCTSLCNTQPWTLWPILSKCNLSLHFERWA